MIITDQHAEFSVTCNFANTMTTDLFLNDLDSLYLTTTLCDLMFIQQHTLYQDIPRHTLQTSCLGRDHRLILTSTHPITRPADATHAMFSSYLTHVLFHSVVHKATSKAKIILSIDLFQICCEPIQSWQRTT